MTPESVITIVQRAMEIMILLSAPMLLIALIVGLLISIFQAATQINEPTLSFIPKLIAIFIGMLVAGPWMLTFMTDYMVRLFKSIPTMVG